MAVEPLLRGPTGVRPTALRAGTLCRMQNLYWRKAIAGGLALLAVAAAAARAEAPSHSLLAGLPPPSLGGPCLRSGHAFLRTRIRGAVRLDIALHGAGLTCEGGPRHAGGGIRMGFEGRVRPVGRIRIIFGVGGAREGRSGRELPTNLTVIFEDRKLLFATQGNGNCTVDRLRQEPVSPGHAPIRPRGAIAKAHAQTTAAKAGSAKRRTYRVVAHGFCIAPINDVSERRRIVVTTFDFAGRADFTSP
jgi:hypothetical protein